MAMLAAIVNRDNNTSHPILVLLGIEFLGVAD